LRLPSFRFGVKGVRVFRVDVEGVVEVPLTLLLLLLLLLAPLTPLALLVVLLLLVVLRERWLCGG
jgi:hypothetical protein